MLIVGANPSKHNLSRFIPFIGSKSDKMLTEWVNFLELDDYTTVNASDRILKKGERLKIGDFDLERLLAKAKEYDMIIVLGKDAAKACDLLQLTYEYLPHPSPLNRVLNNKVMLNLRLHELKEKCHK